MDASLTKKTLNSVAWTYISYGLSKAMVLITTAVLTRLLTKADFGIVGFAVTAMSFLDAVRDLGLGLALIQRRDRVDEAADTVFWISLGSNALLWLISLAAAPLVADFFHEPQITTILPVLSFSFVLSSLGGTHDALLQREMKFARRIIPAVAESLTKGVISIGLALGGSGVWALVAGQMAGRAAFSLMAWRVVAWRPRFRFYRDLAGQLIGFGYKIALDSLLSTLQANIDYVFIGRFLGEAALGVYTVAFRIPELVIINLCIVIAQVLFPAYASLQDDPQGLRRGLLAALRYIALVTLPAGVGLALVSHAFTTTIFGADWADAAPIMAALSIYGALLAVSWNVGDVYKAMGRPDILWKTAVVEFALLAPVLYTLAQRSAFAVSLGHVSVACVVSALRLAIAIRLLKLSVRETLAQFVPAVGGSAVMGVSVWVTQQMAAPLPGLVQLIAAVLVGLLSYDVALWWLERDLMESLSERLADLAGRGDSAREDEALPAEAIPSVPAAALDRTQPIFLPSAPPAPPAPAAVLRKKAPGSPRPTPHVTAPPPQASAAERLLLADLSRLSGESTAQVLLLTRPGVLLACSGDLPDSAVDRVFRLVDTAWKKAQVRHHKSDSLIRFVKLPGVGDYWLYSAPLGDGTVLSLLYPEETPVGTIRLQARHLSQLLARP